MRRVAVLVGLAACSFSPPGVPGAAADAAIDPEEIDGRTVDARLTDGPRTDAGVPDGPSPPDARPPDAAPPPPDARACPVGYALAPVIGGCYRYYPEGEAKTWPNAVDHCDDEPGAHLVVITSAAENAHVLTLLTGDNIYIGLTDQGTEGSFTWVNGEPVGYTNFISGEGTSSSEDCGEMNGTTGGWYDDQCNNARPYVCER